MDYDHKLIVSSGFDSRVLFQYDQDMDNLLKMQEKAHLKSEIQYMDTDMTTLGKFLLESNLIIK